MAEHKPTGNRRYRVHHQWFKKDVLVLQVEISGLVPTYMGGYIDHQQKTWWIDCKPEWRMTMEVE